MFRLVRRAQLAMMFVFLAIAGLTSTSATPANAAAAAASAGCVQTATAASVPADVFLAGGHKYDTVTCTVINAPAFATIVNDPAGTAVPVPIGAENSAYAGAKYTLTAKGKLPNGPRSAACAIRLGASAQKLIYALVKDDSGAWVWVVSVDGIAGTSPTTGATDGLKDCTDHTIMVGDPAFVKPVISKTAAPSSPAASTAGDVTISGDPTNGALPAVDTPSVATPSPAPAADPTVMSPAAPAPAAAPAPTPAPATPAPADPAPAAAPQSPSGGVPGQIDSIRQMIVDLVTKLTDLLKSFFK